MPLLETKAGPMLEELSNSFRFYRYLSYEG